MNPWVQKLLVGYIFSCICKFGEVTNNTRKDACHCQANTGHINNKFSYFYDVCCSRGHNFMSCTLDLGQRYWLGLFNKFSHYKRSRTGGHGFIMFLPSLDHFHKKLSKRRHELSFYLACQILFSDVSDFFVLEKDKIQVAIIYYFVLLIYCRFGDYLICVVRCQCYAAKSLHNLFLAF